MAKITDVIKYEGDNSTFIWKYPEEDFNSLTQLIVHESQEAIFFMNGQALDLFGPGRYTLETQNVPLLGKVINRFTDGTSPFHCEVYFINKTVQMGIKWGTDSRVRFLDPNYGVPLDIGASGELNLAVADSRKLLIKLVGTMNGIAWNEGGLNFTKSLSASFRPLISSQVKANLASTIKTNNINILEIDENLELLSNTLRESILPGFEEYGLTVPEFYVTTVSLPEGENIDQIRYLHSVSLKQRVLESETALEASERQKKIEEEITKTEKARHEAEREIIKAQTEAQSTKLTGFAEAEVMRAKGYTHKDELQAEVQKAYAEGIGNMHIEGGGGAAGDVIGLGVGMAAAGVVAPQLGQMFKGFDPNMQAQPETKTVLCPHCNSEVPENSKFCPECGNKIEILNENEIICPSCGKKTAKGKFCMECGAALVLKCAKCGAEIPKGAKFCLECGEKI